MPTSRCRRVRQQRPLEPALKHYLVTGETLYPPDPWGLAEYPGGAVLAGATLYQPDELRSIWFTHRDEILSRHRSVWAEQKFGSGEEPPRDAGGRTT